MARLCRPVIKIISVMPAATASSTAYWMSGLSTMGIISLGLALVAGRKRVPIPATGKTAFVILGTDRSLKKKGLPHLDRNQLAHLPVIVAARPHQESVSRAQSLFRIYYRDQRQPPHNRFSSIRSLLPSRLPIRFAPWYPPGSDWAEFQ